MFALVNFMQGYFGRAVRVVLGLVLIYAGLFTVGGLHVDLARHQVTIDDKEIHLTPIEFRLLATLIKHAGKVLTHKQLLTEVWGPNQAEQAHYLRVYAAQLRRKLETDPTRPRYLLTEPGVGYRLASE